MAPRGHEAPKSPCPHCKRTIAYSHYAYARGGATTLRYNFRPHKAPGTRGRCPGSEGSWDHASFELARSAPASRPG